MRTRAQQAVVATVVLAAVGGGFALWWLSQPNPDADATAPHSEPSADGERALPRETLRHIVAGGGSTPESNEVSIERDLARAAAVLPEPGVTLYAAGPETAAVRVTARRPPKQTLRSRLGRIFNPRAGRTSTYRRTTLRPDGAATRDDFLDLLAAQIERDGDPLDVYIAGHGDQGETASQNIVAWWGNQVVTPADIAATLDNGPKRRTRFVVTTCFSGGFAEIAFVEADPAAGATPHDVCGLFASTWDREAGGCDPDPDRGIHDGYGVHFLAGLEGARFDGSPLEMEVDFDGDGTTGLLDAHTYARLRSHSIDVPTTTSERFLLSVVAADSPGDGESGLLPHEDAVIGALSGRLKAQTEAEALQAARALDARIAKAAEAETAAATKESQAYWDVAAALLARWPVLDDPWHPEWKATVEANRAEIEAFLDEHPGVDALNRAMAATDDASKRRADLEAKRAPYDRLLRAFQTRRLATVLRDRGGDPWERFQRFRACEAAR